MLKTFSKMLLSAAVFAAPLVGCSEHHDSQTAKTEEIPLITRPQVEIKGDLLTPELLHSMVRVSDPQLSPDGKNVLYGATFVSIEHNRTNRELMVVPADGSETPKQITQTKFGEGQAVWINNGEKIAFISYENGSGQLWSMNADGSNREQISDIKGGITGFLFSPDESKILYTQDIKFGERTTDKYPDLPKVTGRLITGMLYKHWDEWVETIPHPFVASVVNGKVSNDGFDLLEGEPYESPMKPFSGIEDFAWHPNNEQIAYVSRKKTGLEYAVSTNSDVYLFNLADKTVKNLTEGMMGYDIMPSFAPDGSKIAWVSMERDGYESDKKRLFVMDMASGEKSYITSDFDYNVDAFSWKEDGNGFYAIVCKEAVTHLWEIDLNKNIRQITEGEYDYGSFSYRKGQIVAMRNSMQVPADLYAVNPVSGEVKQITNENEAILSKLALPKVEKRWIPTTDGKKMLTWVIYPPHFDPNKKYPALLYCQGGPQSTVSQFWSYRWNFHIMAANGYIVVAPNRRGLPGFGQEWLEQISKDYGGQNMKDYFSAIDAVKKEPYVDENRLGATGASYGGFSVYWLAGNHNKRFHAFAAHAGIFNLEQQYLETEELWFANWDMGGNYWDKSNKVAQRTFANSPHKFVDRWDTPILVTHGEKDYRILASQGMAAFDAAQIRGIPSEMLIFPDENHWILQPQNGVLFQRVFFDWFDRWLK